MIDKCVIEKKENIYREIEGNVGNYSVKTKNGTYFFLYDEFGIKNTDYFNEGVRTYLSNHPDYGPSMCEGWCSSPMLKEGYLQVKVAMPKYVENIIREGLQRKEDIAAGKKFVEENIEEIKEDQKRSSEVNSSEDKDTQNNPFEKIDEEVFDKETSEVKSKQDISLGEWVEEMFSDEIPEEADYNWQLFGEDDRAIYAEYEDSDEIDEDTRKNPEDYKEYLFVKSRLLAKILDKFDRFKKATPYTSKNYKEKSKQYREVISKLENEIRELRQNLNKEGVYQDVYNEVDYLNKILETVKFDELNVTEFENRLDILCRYFLGTTVNNVAVSVQKDMFIPLQEKYPQDFQKVKNLVHNLHRKYIEKLSSFIYELAVSNPLVEEHIASGKFNPETIFEVIKSEINNIKDISILHRHFLGAGTGGGILGQLIRIYFESKLRTEQGATSQKIERLQTLWSLINLKEKDSTMLFIQHRTITDAKGFRYKMRTDKLISPFSIWGGRNSSLFKEIKSLISC